MRHKKYSEASVILILVIVFLLALNATLGILLTRQSSAALTDLIDGRMLDISNTAAAMLDGDALSRLTAEDAGTEEYQAVMDTLRYFQDNIELRYIYCIQDLGNGSFAFSVDPTVEDPGEFGSPVVYTDALDTASQGTPAVDKEPYQDAWGSFYSAYSPVFTSDGRVGGIVAVDFSAEWFDRQVSQLVRTVVAVGVLSLVVGVLVVAGLARRNARRYRTVYTQLNELAGRVEELVREMENGSVLSAREKQALRSSTEELRQGKDIDALGEKILSMQDEIRRHIEIIHKQAYLDALTGVGNKAAYLETTRHLESMIQEGIAVFAVAVFDLNGLKTINDNYGHERGDLALIDAAELLKEVFGGENVYRVGGDEFIAILKQPDELELRLLFDRLDDELAKTNAVPRPYEAPLVLSKGAAVYKPGEDPDYKSVFRRADRAMYEDKAAYYTKYADRRRR